MSDILTIHGRPVPALGFGTWPLRGDACARAIEQALGLGYRHLDTAQYYENEADVGRGLRRAGIPREDVFLVTKLHPAHFAYADALRTTRDSLRRLGTEYVDLLLLHWPNPEVPLEETLRALRQLQEDGAARHVGLSNFTTEGVERAAQHVEVFCNQMEYHPYHPQDDLIEQARARGVLFTAYSPLAKGRVVEDATLREIGAGHGKTAAQVALRWILQQDLAAIPKAASVEHQAANLDVFDFCLSDEEMAAIRALGR